MDNSSFETQKLNNRSMERVDLLTNEPRYSPDEISNLNSGLCQGIIAMLALAAVGTGSWFIYYWTSQTLWLVHSIFITFAF